MKNYNSPNAHLLKSIPKFLYASASTLVDVVVGLWILFPLLDVLGLLSSLEPAVTSRLFSAYLVTAIAGWVLYVTAWSTRVDNMESFSTSDAGEMPEELKDVDSIEEVNYKRILNKVYLNGVATVYKVIAIFTAAVIGTMASGVFLTAGVLVAVAYAPTDYRAAKVRWWLSPTMLAMASMLVILYLLVTVAQLMITRRSSTVPSIRSLIAAIQPTQFSLLGLFSRLFLTVDSVSPRG